METEFENILACLSGAQMDSNHEKNWRSKISWHTPFKTLFYTQNSKFANIYVIKAEEADSSR